MNKLTIQEPLFYSYLDEKSFFRWLDDLSAVESYKGGARGLELSLRNKLSEAELRDLLAWMTRYDLDRTALRGLCTEQNKTWFKRRGSFWYRAVFGKRK